MGCRTYIGELRQRVDNYLGHSDSSAVHLNFGSSLFSVKLRSEPTAEKNAVDYWLIPSPSPRPLPGGEGGVRGKALFDFPSRPYPSSHSSDSTKNREEPKFLFEIRLIVANIRARSAKGQRRLRIAAGVCFRCSHGAAAVPN